MVDPATLPEVAAPKTVSKRSKKTNEEEEEERRIDLSEIIGLPDFDVSILPPPLIALHFLIIDLIRWTWIWGQQKNR
jgi:hypothetical protein